MPLLQRLKDTDMESFKQARACGMIPIHPQLFAPISSGFPLSSPSTPEFEREYNPYVFAFCL